MNRQIKFNYKMIAIIAAAIIVLAWFIPTWGVSINQKILGEKIDAKLNVSGLALTFTGVKATAMGETEKIYDGNFLFIFFLLIPIAGLAVHFINGIQKRLQLWISTGVALLTTIAWFIAKAIAVSKVKDEMGGFGGFFDIGSLIKMKFGLILMLLATICLIAITVLEFLGKIELEGSLAFNGAGMPRNNYGYAQQGMYQQNPYGQQGMPGQNPYRQQGMGQQGMYQQQGMGMPQQGMQGQAPVQAKFCTKCGNKVAPGARFCTKCGNPMA